MEILTPCKIETLEQIDTQLVRIDYVHELNVCSKFGKTPFTGDFWAKVWNITFCVTFLFIYLFIFIFSDQRREETPGRILTRNGSKDAESRKELPFWVIKWNIEIWPLFTPQNPQNLALNMQFPAKMMKHETPSISKSTKPIEMKI